MNRSRFDTRVCFPDVYVLSGLVNIDIIRLTVSFGTMNADGVALNPEIEWTPLLRTSLPMLRIFLSALALAMCSFMGCTSSSTMTDSDSAETETTTQAGKDAAADDITAGKLVLRSQNLPSPPGHNEYTKLLTDRCGFSFEMVAGKLTDADNAYNEAMMAEARRKYGNDIFSRLKAEAKTNFEQGL